MLKTERLILRPWQENDAERLYELAKHPEVGPPAGWPPHTSVEHSREIIRNVLMVAETYAVCQKDGRVVGCAGLKRKGYTDMTDREDECELGYWVGKPFWGQGLIPEAARELLRHAFEDLHMRAVWCGYYDGNEKSHRVQQKLGFVYHHTAHNLDVTLLNEKRTGHISLLTKRQWEWIQKWKAEENIAYIHGWDFSHIEGRYTEETDFPWDYRKVIGEYLTPETKLLDVDTGGGEFLLSLGHPYENTAATENYAPNVKLCKEALIPIGIDFRQADGTGALPYPDDSFDMVINRHGDFNPREIYRVLKKGGMFVSQQVGAENDRELVELLCGDVPMPFPQQYADTVGEQFLNVGFSVLRKEECFRPIRFYDVGALVWFARVIPWEFPNFSVNTHLESLRNAQRILEDKGCIDGKTHRFLLVTRKT